uniref:CAP domain-containing protein (inferred by orthology to a zebrafish protein) n=1 Tax=Strongyloides venezuelensis TaxID=75913 RepID=A0A0K0FXI5_STRVS
MRLKYFFLLYISSVCNILEAQYIVYEYVSKYYDNREYCYYNKYYFSSKKRMVNFILRQNPFLHKRFFFIHKIAEVHQNGKIDMNYKYQYQPVLLNKKKEGYSTTIYGEKPYSSFANAFIVKYTTNGEVKYECNSRIFSTFQEALRYYRLKHRRVHFDKTTIHTFDPNSPPNAITHHRTNRNSIMDKKNDRNQVIWTLSLYLGSNYFSNQIWTRIWSNCNYECLFANNHLRLKQKLLREANEYRRAHKAKPLFEHSKMSREAQLLANSIAHYQRIFRDGNKKYGETVAMVYYELGPMVVKRWYDEIKYYFFKSYRTFKEARDFSQLVWKKSKNVGIGVAECYHNKLVVVFKYYPKGNVPILYRYNVKPRKF